MESKQVARVRETPAETPEGQDCAFHVGATVAAPCLRCGDRFSAHVGRATALPIPPRVVSRDDEDGRP